MSGKKDSNTDRIWRSLRTGALAVGITLILLLPLAFLEWKGRIGEGGLTYGIWILSFISGITACLAEKPRGNATYMEILMTGAIASFLLLILSAGIPETRIRFMSILPTSLALTLGAGTGRIMQNNKTDRRKRRKG